MRGHCKIKKAIIKPLAVLFFCLIYPLLWSEPANPDNSNKNVVKFGIISRYNPYIMYRDYQPIIDYLTQNTPYQFELKLGKTYEDTVNYLASGVIDVASLGALTYLEAHQRFGAIPILKPLNARGQPFYRSIIIIRNDSPIHSLKELKGHSFAFASLHSTSGNFISRYYLAQNDIHLKDLKNYVNLMHHDTVAEAVLKGKYDAGSVKDIIAYKYQEKGLRFLYKSPLIPGVPITVRPDAPKELIGWIKKALLALDRNNPEHKKLMQTWDAEFQHGFIEAEDADYEPLRKVFNNIPEGCGKGCHPRIFF
jgi:phosphonate transport system substrate-binding protein